MSIHRQYLVGVLVAVVTMASSACGHFDSYSDRGHIDTTETGPARNNIVRQAYRLIGVPYRYGGTSPTWGMDCSGLIYYVYQQEGIEVPRTTKQQFNLTRPVRKTELQPGDLVFFRLRYATFHVGLYIGNNLFIHAPSTGKKVQKTRLNHPFWYQRWIRGGRFANLHSSLWFQGTPRDQDV